MGPVLSFWLQCNEINLTNMAESALKMHLDRTAVWLSEPLLTSLTANCKCNAPPVCTSGKQRQTETRHPDVFYSMFYIKVKLYTIESPILETNVWDHGLIRKLFFFCFFLLSRSFSRELTFNMTSFRPLLAMSNNPGWRHFSIGFGLYYIQLMGKRHHSEHATMTVAAVFPFTHHNRQ